jgi:poly(glycerol-phosphate) alpha-glucosyltransferase
MLFMGRIHPKKGLVETITAWAKVLGARPELAQRWVLAIAGWDDGGHLAVLQALVASLGLSGQVVFLGPLFGADKDSVLRCVNAFILSSYSEGQPMAVLEAWAYSLPVFMTRSCNLEEGFTDGAAIELTTDAGRMAFVLARYLDDPELPSIGEAGRRLVERKYSWDYVSSAFLQLYCWLVHGGRLPETVVPR